MIRLTLPISNTLKFLNQSQINFAVCGNINDTNDNIKTAQKINVRQGGSDKTLRSSSHTVLKITLVPYFFTYQFFAALGPFCDKQFSVR